MDVRHIVVVSDLHAGSAVAICPKAVTLDDGGTYRRSKYQDVLGHWWDQFWGKWVPRVTGGEPFVLVVNGDALEGRHHNAIDPISLNLATQRKIAEALLVPIVQLAAAFYLIRGTQAHDGKMAEQTEELGKALGAAQCEDLHSWWDLDLELGRYVVNCRHTIGTTSSAAYETSALNRELVAELSEAGQWDDFYPDALVRSHRHRFCHITLPASESLVQVVVTPGWQLVTPHGHNMGARRRPQIGGVCLTAEPDELKVRCKIWAPRKEKPERVKLGRKSSGKNSSATSKRRKSKRSTAR